MTKKKNQLPVELCYNYHFDRSDSSILDHHHCEKNGQKIQPIKIYQTKSTID